MSRFQSTGAVKRNMTTKTLAYCAMLAALQIVLARFVSIVPTRDMRISIEAIPLVLAGLLFGPVPGVMVGFAADFIGCITLNPFPYNPIFSIPPMLYGLCGGLFRYWVSQKTSFLRVLTAYLPPVILGSILWQSGAIAYINNSQGAFMESLMVLLSSRSIQFAVVGPLEAVITFFLLKSGIFQALKIWPLAPKAKK